MKHPKHAYTIVPTIGGNPWGSLGYTASSTIPLIYFKWNIPLFEQITMTPLPPENRGISRSILASTFKILRWHYAKRHRKHFESPLSTRLSSQKVQKVPASAGSRLKVYKTCQHKNKSGATTACNGNLTEDGKTVAGKTMHGNEPVFDFTFFP